MNQLLDLQGQFYVPAAIKPLTGTALVGLELGKLRLPKAQYISLDAANAGHVANLEIEAVGDRRCVKVASFGLLHSHNEGEQRTEKGGQSALVGL